VADYYCNCNKYFLIGCRFKHLCCKFTTTDVCIVRYAYCLSQLTSLYTLQTYVKPMGMRLYYVIYDRLRACLKVYVSIQPFSLLLLLFSVVLC